MSKLLEKPIIKKLLNKKKFGWHICMLGIPLGIEVIGILLNFITTANLSVLFNGLSIIQFVLVAFYIFHVFGRLMSDDNIEEAPFVKKFMDKKSSLWHFGVMGIILVLGLITTRFVGALYQIIPLEQIMNIIMSILILAKKIILYTYGVHLLYRLIAGDKFYKNAFAVFAFVVVILFTFEYQTALSKLLVLGILGGIYYIFRIVKLAKKKSVGAEVGTLILVGTLFFCGSFGLYMGLPEANVVKTKEVYVTDVSYKYNKDGTIRHDSDGNKVLDTDYASRTVTSSGTNYTLLLYTALIYGALVYGLTSVDNTESEHSAKKV